MVNVIYGRLPDGSGSGSGYGYGSYGYGNGYGDGYGDGDGSLKYAVDGFVSLLVAEKRKRVKYLRRNKAVIAYWKSGSDGRACNGGSGEPVRVGLIEKSAGPLVLCNKGVLHATYTPQDWKGDRIWLVALCGKVVEQDEKLGALQREFIAEITPTAMSRR